MELNNYFFYRLYSHYKENPIFTAAIYITLLQVTFLFFTLLTFNALAYPDRILLKELVQKNGIGKNVINVSTVVFYVLLQLANYLYYKHKVKQLEVKFANHPWNSWFRLWMLIVLALFFFIFPIVLFKIRN